MRIAICSDTFAPDLNGVAMTLERITRRLAARGHEVLICVPQEKAEWAEERAGISWLTLASLPLPGYPGLRLGIPRAKTLRKAWVEFLPDVVYAATESALGLAVLKAAGKLSVPVVSGYHTNFDTYLKDYHLPFLEDSMGGWLRHFHNRTRRTLAPCAEVGQRLHEFGIDEVGILGRGVDAELFDPKKRSTQLRAEWGIDDNAPVALYVGRIALEKNFDLVVRAFQSFLELAPDGAVVVVGDGPIRADLEQAYPDFHFAGPRRGEDLARHYASADLFVFASMSETYGNVVPEAMASGLCALAFDYAAPAEMIRTGENGILVPFDDEPAFLQAMPQAVELSRDQALRKAARETAASRSWDAVVDDFENHLEDAIKAHAAQGASDPS